MGPFIFQKFSLKALRLINCIVSVGKYVAFTKCHKVAQVFLIKLFENSFFVGDLRKYFSLGDWIKQKFAWISNIKKNILMNLLEAIIENGFPSSQRKVVNKILKILF